MLAQPEASSRSLRRTLSSELASDKLCENRLAANRCQTRQRQHKIVHGGWAPLKNARIDFSNQILRDCKALSYIRRRP
jgi:hypothetical protein